MRGVECYHYNIIFIANPALLHQHFTQLCTCSKDTQQLRKQKHTLYRRLVFLSLESISTHQPRRLCHLRHKCHCHDRLGQHRTPLSASLQQLHVCGPLESKAAKEETHPSLCCCRRFRRPGRGAGSLRSRGGRTGRGWAGAGSRKVPSLWPVWLSAQQTRE